jgi:hypothetical protein
LADAAGEFLTGLDATEHPHVIAHVHSHLNEAPTTSAFEFGLDLILDGLARLGTNRRSPRNR